MKKVNEVMTKGCQCVSPDTSLQQAAQQMKSLNVGVFPVCSKDRLAGVVTDRDIVIRGIAKGLDTQGSKVSDVMTEGIDFCFEDEDLESVAQKMEEKKIRRLPVLNRDKRMVGIVSLGDLAVKADTGKAGECLEEVSKPAQPEK